MSKRSYILKCKTCQKSYSWAAGLSRGMFCSSACVVESPIVVTNTEEVVPKKIPTGVRTLFGKRKNRRKKVRKHKRDNFYMSGAWRALRYDVLKHYGRQCMLCHATKGSMHVDHIIPRSQRKDLELDFNNLQVLCEECNLGKLDRDRADFRPKDKLKAS